MGRSFVFTLKYWLPVVMWAGLIVYLSSIPSLETGMPGLWDLIGRKIGHMVEYVVLTSLLWRALRAHGLPPRSALLWSASLALTFAVSDEIHQAFVPGREGHIRDVLIDGLGVGAGLSLTRLESAARVPKPAKPPRNEQSKS